MTATEDISCSGFRQYVCTLILRTHSEKNDNIASHSILALVSLPVVGITSSHCAAGWLPFTIQCLWNCRLKLSMYFPLPRRRGRYKKVLFTPVHLQILEKRSDKIRSDINNCNLEVQFCNLQSILYLVIGKIMCKYDPFDVFCLFRLMATRTGSSDLLANADFAVSWWFRPGNGHRRYLTTLEAGATCNSCLPNSQGWEWGLQKQQGSSMASC